jgi:hypothetical protein
VPTSLVSKPKNLFRRAERVLVGAGMWVIAVVLEKVVMRALKKEGTPVPKPGAEPTPIVTRGSAIEFEPET